MATRIMINSFTQGIALIATIKFDITTKVWDKHKYNRKSQKITFWYTMLTFEFITLHG